MVFPQDHIIGQQAMTRQSSASPLDHVSSADLPAEFRDNSSDDGSISDETTLADNDTPKEQSKLAKLCEQTSSVLASVLPAPFGGHKRSILCQFFGQVPIKTSSNQFQSKQQPSNNLVRQYNNNQMQPSLSGGPYDNVESIAVLHQAQRGPLTFHSNGKHPIQIVLEQQQRQLTRQSNLASNNLPIDASHPLASSMRQVPPAQEDLKSSASIVDYSYQQKLEPPNSMRKELSSASKGSQVKFSTPITSSSTSFKPIQVASQTVTSSTSKPQMLISTSGWRIFNQPPQEMAVHQQSVTTQSSKSSSATPTMNNNKSKEEGVKSSKSDLEEMKARQAPNLKNISAIAAAFQTTTPVSSPQYSINKITTSAPSMISKNKNKQQETLNFGSAQLLVMGRPPGFDGNSSEANRSSLYKTSFPPATYSSSSSVDSSQRQTTATTSIGKRSEVLKSTTRTLDNNNYNNSSKATTQNLASSSPAPEVRIIEVIAQQTSNNSLVSDQLASASNSGNNSTLSTTTTTTSTQKPTTDLHQVQQREELVIASINNLTRIAFGNQLRDTVKVINKLIDQQADLFGKNLNRGEPLIASESRQIVTGNNKLTSGGSGSELIVGAKNNNDIGSKNKSTKQVSSSSSSSSLTKSSQTGGGNIYSGKQRNSTNDKSIRQKQNAQSASLPKPTKRPKKQTVSSSTATTRNKSPATSSATETKESIKPKAATFSSQKLTTSLPSTIGRGLLRSTQSRSSRNIDQILPIKAGDEARSSSSVAQKYNSNSTIANLDQRVPSSSGAKLVAPSKRTSSTISDLDSIVPTVTISDIHRDKSPWKFSPSPYIRDLTLPNTIRKSSTTLNPNSYGTKLSDVTKSKAATVLPWMLPEHSSSNHESNLFSTTISSMRKSTTPGDTIKRWTSSRKYQSSSSLSSSSKQPLVLNKLENIKSFEPKMDSLTTLKMSLTTQPSLSIAVQSSSLNPASEFNTNSYSQSATSQTSLSQNGGTSTQSRWIPTSSISARPQSIATSTSNPITTTTPMPPPTKAQLKEVASISGVDSNQPTTIKKPPPISANSQEVINQNDLNEARASDSISKYTTHWNEANEILSTTRRFFQQPLPQIAQTGEFFNAETISTWPERYQTMLNSNIEGKTTPSFETTRRNGETYEKTSRNLARHKFDTTLASSNGDEQYNAGIRTTRIDPTFMLLNNNSMSSITILPSNHKLTTTFSEETSNNGVTKQTTVVSGNNGEQYNTNFANNEQARDETQPETYTQGTTNDDMMITEAPQIPTLKSQQQKSILSSPTVSYTLIGPYTNFKPEQKQEGVVSVEKVKFPRISDDYLIPSDTNQQAKDDSTIQSESATNNKANISNSNASSSSFLKPPYLESHQRDRDHDIPTSNLSSLERHNVSRKLYELLVPSTKSFVGPQNPLNLQRFSLSALKFLAQNILMPNRSNQIQYSSNSTNGDTSREHSLTSQNDELENDDSNSKSQEQLLELLDPSLPMNYYDLLASNESSQVNNRTSGKSILGRAGNFLNDLKQAESKRAAALLAAIRYQVPSPLVRPWDTVSDHHHHSNGLLNSNERLDGLIENIGDKREGNEESESVSLRDSLLLAQLSNSIKSALFKQRIVPKNELEARLRLHNHNPVIIDEDQDIALDRRSDSQTKPSKIDSYSLDEMNDYFGNVSKSNSEYLYDKFPLRSGRNFTKNLLNTLLNSTSALKLPSIMRINNNKTNNNFVDQIDFSAVQLQQQQQRDEMQNLNDRTQYPKYIRLTDNKAAWSLNQEGSLKATSRQPSLPSSAVAAKLRDSASRNKKVVVEPDNDVKMLQEYENKAEIKTNEFDCDGKQAGFYPDSETACQVSS